MQNPENITENAKKIVLDLLPVNSGQIYEKESEAFIRRKETLCFIYVNDVFNCLLIWKKRKFFETSNPVLFWSFFFLFS
jgi:hypothetical protein